jgi:GTP cyclohydrolase I
MEEIVAKLLQAIGEDPHREGLRKTPKRTAESFRFLTSGYVLKLEDVVNGALLPADTTGMVIVKDIECYSLCEHHLLPFVGKVHVGYIPDRHVIGLSKIPRVIDMFARRLQVQERLGEQIANALVSILKPKGLGVIIEASHFCMMMRGVEKQHSIAVTSHLRGLFLTDPKTREEFTKLVRGNT